MMFMSRELKNVYMFMCMCVCVCGGVGTEQCSCQMTIVGARSVLPHCLRQDPLVLGAIYKLQPSLGVSLAFGTIYVLQTSQPVSLQTLVSLPPILHIGEAGQQRCVLLS